MLQKETVAQLDAILLGDADPEDFLGRGYSIVLDGRELRGVFSRGDLRKSGNVLYVAIIEADCDDNSVVYNALDGKVYMVVGGAIPFDIESMTIEAAKANPTS